MGVTTPTSENLRFPGGGWHGITWQEWGEGDGGTTPPEPGESAYNAAVLADNPAAFWPLNDAPGAATLVDLAARANHAPTPAGLTLGTTGIGDGETGALVAPGDSGYFAVPGADFGLPWPEEMGPHSIEIWAYVDPMLNQALLSLDSYGDYSWVLSTYAGNINYQSHLSPPDFPWVGVPRPTGLHYLVGTYDGSAMVLYVDGEVAGSVDATGTSAVFEVGVMGRRGVLDEVEGEGEAESEGEGEVMATEGRFAKPAVYGYPLSAARVRAHYEAAS